MNIYIIGEYREQFTSKIDGINFNPHPSYSNILDIQNACKEKGIDCIYYGGIYELVHAIDTHEHFSSDVLFLNISDGLTQPYCRLQAPVLLDILGVKYTGSTPFVVSLMNNKHYTKIALGKFNFDEIQIPQGILLNKKELPSDAYINSIQYPVIVKPNNDGFSMGIDSKSVTYSYSETIEKIMSLQKEYDEILVEEYIPGIDVSTFLIGNTSKIIINEVIAYKTHGTFHQSMSVRDIYAKANKLSEKYPASECLSPGMIQKVQNISEKIFNILNARDIARIDYRITADNKIYFLEINANPILSSTSDTQIVCQNLDITYSDLIYLYIKTAFERYK